MYVIRRLCDEVDGCGCERDCGERNGNENGKDSVNRNEDITQNKTECYYNRINSKVLSTLQSDFFLQGHQHTASSFQSTFFDFPTNSQLLICYINNGFICWKFEHKPCKSFAIPSLQIYPFPPTNEISGSLNPLNRVLMITFTSGSLECKF